MKAAKTRFKIKLGSKIKQYRLAHKLLQKELALCLGCSQTLVGQIENGDGMPNIGMIYKMCILFKCDITDFLPNVREIEDNDFIDLHF